MSEVVSNELTGVDEDGNVTIAYTLYTKLMNDSAFLQVLHNNGVDNWEWYGDALEEFNDGENN